VTVHAKERIDDFLRVFGTLTVPVVAPEIQLVGLPCRGLTWVYMLDLNRIHAGQRDALVDYIVERFGESRDRVRRDLAHVGMPIVAEGTTLFVGGQKADPRTSRRPSWWQALLLCGLLAAVEVVMDVVDLVDELRDARPPNGAARALSERLPLRSWWRLVLAAVLVAAAAAALLAAASMPGSGQLPGPVTPVDPPRLLHR